ncbi:YbaB/EbfC family nucleoid-associated protein [Actinomadura sp. DC4]|uniref:YbaB/EbfC family nucleoid-associated protein n=1 Tax=Actinomadura sp. DC4 TaxID=3055069 RepID=UPI0025B212A5|nr:YbaB/EbfC family nucleoid-associated protein [Actinomadura sp. DC4]MDN3351816.1 YbaB/EbfC family nucleoid-associated protein [Actinomadura sp. DC4]
MEFDRESLERDLRALESRTRETQEELDTLAVGAKSKDGLIELTVVSPGRVHELTLDPRVKRLDIEDLSERIVAMTNDALDLLHEETAAKVGALLPDFSPDELFGGGRS